MRPPVALAAAGMALLFQGENGAAPAPLPPSPNHFIGITNFASFTTAPRPDGMVMISPWLDGGPGWNELVVSWNVSGPPDGGLKVEARGAGGDVTSPFMTLGLWSEDPAQSPRQSVPKQRDQLASVKTDLMVFNQPMRRVQVRLTLSRGAAGQTPVLRFLGLSLHDTNRVTPVQPPERAAWGRVLEVPQRSQLGHPGANGWCSPTSVSMVLGFWARELKRPSLDHSVPEVARGVYDPNLPGTGNWPFNTAFASREQGLHAYVRHLNGLRDLEEWVSAGVPVIASVSFDLLNGEPQDQGNGHLVVVVGFTPSGEVVINDPWPQPKGQNKVRRVFPRRNLELAWQRSHQIVYLIHPENWRTPAGGEAPSPR